MIFYAVYLMHDANLFVSLLFNGDKCDMCHHEKTNELVGDLRVPFVRSVWLNGLAAKWFLFFFISLSLGVLAKMAVRSATNKTFDVAHHSIPHGNTKATTTQRKKSYEIRLKLNQHKTPTLTIIQFQFFARCPSHSLSL